VTIGSTALERCVGEPEPFIAEHFGRRPLVRRHGSDAFADLFDLAAADDLITTAGLRTPAVRLVRDGTGIASSTWTTSATIGGVSMPNIVDPRAVLREFDDGATLVLQGLHRFLAPLRRFCRELEVALGHPCQVNAYLTPAYAQGLALHHDSHDVFVMQTFGSKRWEVHADDEEPWDLVLEPGDVLYMPAGTPHAARAQDGISGHLTIGVLSVTWRAFLRKAVGQALDDPLFAAPLPGGWHLDPDGFTGMVRDQLDLLVDRIAKLDAAGVVADEADDVLRSRHPLVAGAFAARAGLDSLSGATWVRLRPGAIAEPRTRGDEVALLIGDRELRMPAWVGPAVRRVVDGSSLRVDDLSMIDEQSRLVLVRRLVREGVLEILT
jgi:bifunctional lysine-specific demethylase and histidyl-hydroxylase NO66